MAAKSLFAVLWALGMSCGASAFAQAEPAASAPAAKLRALSQLLRCHHTGKRHAMSERLIQILSSCHRMPADFRARRGVEDGHAFAGRAPVAGNVKANLRIHHYLPRM